MFACCRPSGPPSVANCGNCDGRLGYQAFSPSRAKKDEPNGHQEEPSGRPLRPKDHESSELLRAFSQAHWVAEFPRKALKVSPPGTIPVSSRSSSMIRCRY